jgi:two-component system sensor histidine kinase VanS
MSGRRLSARARITLVTSALVLLTAATTVTAIVIAMQLIPDYQFGNTLTPAGSTLGRTIPSAHTVLTPTPVSAVVISDPIGLIKSLLVFGILALILIGAAGVVGSWVVAGRILKPLKTLNAAARRASSGALDHRVPLSGPNDEFRELGITFNEMLDGLERSFDMHERFAANASHELRTPLSTTKLLLEVERSHEHPAELVVLFDRLQTMNDRTLGIVAALLELADVASHRLEREHVNLADVVVEALNGVEDEAGTRDITISMDLDNGGLLGSRVLLGQAVSNLVGNAIQHNRDAGYVTISIQVEKGALILRVENTGAQISASSLALLQEPFYRGGGRLSSDGSSSLHGSHGLGLPLVGRIVDAHNGSLSIEARNGGGLIATVRLPSS